MVCLVCFLLFLWFGLVDFGVQLFVNVFTFFGFLWWFYLVGKVVGAGSIVNLFTLWVCLEGLFDSGTVVLLVLFGRVLGWLVWFFGALRVARGDGLGDRILVWQGYF